MVVRLCMVRFLGIVKGEGEKKGEGGEGYSVYLHSFLAAGYNQHAECVALLLVRGADPNMANKVSLSARQDVSYLILLHPYPSALYPYPSLTSFTFNATNLLILFSG